MKKGTVEHEGVVVAVRGNSIKVQIESKSACAACHAKGLCSASDMKDKYIDVYAPDTENGIESYKIGERVVVSMRESAGLKAVWIVYAVPVIILLAFLLYLQRLNLSELQVGLIVIAAMALYFFILYLLRGRIGKNIRFTAYKARF